MQLHELRPKHKLKTKQRFGRGGKRGNYSGRGIKGQKSRSGHRFQPVIRELIKRYPKLRGYRFNPKSSGQQALTAVLNVEVLEQRFKEGEKITPAILIERKIIRQIRGRVPRVKILSKGEIKKSLQIEGCLFSKMAKEKIEKAGGKII